MDQDQGIPAEELGIRQMEAEAIARAAKDAEFAHRVAEFRLSPLFKDLQDEVDRRVGLLGRGWLLGNDPAKVEQMRQDARGYHKFFGLLDEIVARGDNARKILEAAKE